MFDDKNPLPFLLLEPENLKRKLYFEILGKVSKWTMCRLSYIIYLTLIFLILNCPDYASFWDIFLLLFKKRKYNAYTTAPMAIFHEPCNKITYTK